MSEQTVRRYRPMPLIRAERRAAESWRAYVADPANLEAEELAWEDRDVLSALALAYAARNSRRP